MISTSRYALLTSPFVGRGNPPRGENGLWAVFVILSSVLSFEKQQFVLETTKTTSHPSTTLERRGEDGAIGIIYGRFMRDLCLKYGLRAHISNY
jgi:hypothetical protein